MTERLTQKYVNSLKASEKPYSIPDGVIPGLSIYVGSKSRTWYLAFRDGRKLIKHKVGSAAVYTVEQARDIARDVLDSVRKGENPHIKPIETDKIIVKTLFSEYEKWLRDNRRGGSATAAMIKSSFEDFFKLPVVDIRVPIFQTWRTKKLESGAKKSTVNRLLGALKTMFNWGFQNDYINANPIAKLKPVREDDSDAKVRYLSDDELSRLMAALDDREQARREGRDSHNKWLASRKKAKIPALKGEYADYLKPLVLVALNVGARRGAIFSLKWGDVDIESESPVILFRAASAKNQKSLRVPLNSSIAAVLGKWRLQNARLGADDYVFQSPKTGGRLTNINKSWAALMKAANIENFRFHDMRHDYASRLVMSGIDLFTVKELLGHSDIGMTQRYAHLAPDKLRAAVETIVRKPAVK